MKYKSLTARGALNPGKRAEGFLASFQWSKKQAPGEGFYNFRGLKVEKLQKCISRVSFLYKKAHILLKKTGKKMLTYSYLWIEKLAITDEKYYKCSCHITMKMSVAKELQRASMRQYNIRYLKSGSDLFHFHHKLLTVCRAGPRLRPIKVKD